MFANTTLAKPRKIIRLQYREHYSPLHQELSVTRQNLKQEAELKQLEKKLKIGLAKIRAGISPETEAEAHGKIKLGGGGGETNIPDQKTDQPTKKALQLLNASLPKHDFKISSHIGGPCQNEKLSLYY